MLPASSSPFPKQDFGLPPRPPTAETPLWEHFLRPSKEKPPTLQSMPIMAPPLAPLDKNATSMRVLLHDTQANFEKFAKLVGQLLHEVQETHTQMKTTHSLFERDRESLTGDILDLVNRSQKEVQKSVGNPSQHDAVESLFKDVTHRLSGLDQRLDAIQAFNQTHSQALQSQIQAVQLLLDKQGSIIAAVVPLLPLLQAIPLHIDAAKSSLSEYLTGLLSSYKPAVISVDASNVCPITPISEPPHPQAGKRKEADADIFSSASPVQISETVLKKPRLDTPGRSCSFSMRTSLSNNNVSVPTLSEAISSSPLGHIISSDEIKTDTGVSSPTGEAIIQTHVNRAPSSRPGTFAVPAIPATPRRPLGDLPVPHISQTPTNSAFADVSRRSFTATGKGTGFLNYPLGETSAKSRTVTPTSSTAAVRTSGLPLNASRTPRILRSHENNFKRSFSVVSDSSYLSSGTAVDVSDRDFIVPKPEHEAEGNIQKRYPTRSRTNMTSVSAAASRTVMTRSSTLIQGTDSRPRPRPRYTRAAQSVEMQAMSVLPPIVVGDPSNNVDGQSTSAPLSTPSKKQKEQRSPVSQREGRRFIPLVDSDEEELAEE